MRELLLVVTAALEDLLGSCQLHVAISTVDLRLSQVVVRASLLKHHVLVLDLSQAVPVSQLCVADCLIYLRPVQAESTQAHAVHGW